MVRKSRFPRPLLFVCVILAAALFFFHCDKGAAPVGLADTDTLPRPNDLNPDLDTVVWQAGQIHLIADPSHLRAAFGDTARITVVAYDNSHNPVSGKTVTFWASAGMITPATVVTNASGTASAKFMSVPVNTEAIIIARLKLTDDSLVQTGTNITLSGLTVDVLPSAENG